MLPALQKKGLVEKVISAPSIYKAISIEEGLNILLHRKTKEYTELQNNTNKMRDKFHNSSILSAQDEESQFIVTSEEGLTKKRLEQQLYSAQTSIYTVSTWKCCGNMIRKYSNDLKKATKKGIKVRALTDRYEQEKSTTDFLQDLKKNPNFEIRYTNLPIQIKMTITDLKNTNLCISTSVKQGLPNMWSNNPNFAQLAILCFEEMWKEAKP